MDACEYGGLMGMHMTVHRSWAMSGGAGGAVDAAVNKDWGAAAAKALPGPARRESWGWPIGSRDRYRLSGARASRIGMRISAGVGIEKGA